jgi:hypothetical protein
MGAFRQLRVTRRIENHLSAALAVAQFDENKPAQVTADIQPSGQGDALTDVFGAQFVAMMGAFQWIFRG